MVVKSKILRTKDKVSKVRKLCNEACKKHCINPDEPKIKKKVVSPGSPQSRLKRSVSTATSGFIGHPSCGKQMEIRKRFIKEYKKLIKIQSQETDPVFSICRKHPKRPDFYEIRRGDNVVATVNYWYNKHPKDNKSVYTQVCEYDIERKYTECSKKGKKKPKKKK